MTGLAGRQSRQQAPQQRRIHNKAGLLHIIRHGESLVNAQGRRYKAEGDAEHFRAYHEAEFLDCPLTAEGRRGAMEDVPLELRKGLREGSVRIVVTSTLRRALETAIHGVGPVISPGPSTPWLALDCVREATACEVHLVDGAHVEKEVLKEKPCNYRGSLEQVRGDFPHVDFSLCQNEDPLERLETIAMVERRVSQFAAWLRERIEREKKTCGEDAVFDVVVVSHFVYMQRLLSKLPSCQHGEDSRLGNNEVKVVSLEEVMALA